MVGGLDAVLTGADVNLTGTGAGLAAGFFGADGFSVLGWVLAF